MEAIIKKKTSLLIFLFFLSACNVNGDKTGTAENKETFKEQDYKNADADIAQNEELLKDIDK